MDARDGAPWLARACVVHCPSPALGRGEQARRRRVQAGADSGPRRRCTRTGRELGARRAGLQQLRRGPNARLDRLFYGCRRIGGTIGRSDRGPRGLCLTGMALAYSQLYHRFGMESEDVVTSGRTTAEMAVDITHQRLMRPGFPPVVSHNASRGVRSGTVTEAFTTHMTQTKRRPRSTSAV